mgnify:CR=1 FL=1
MKVDDIFRLVEECGGKVEEIHGPLSDGSGFALASFPLPKDHWLTKEGYNDPPTPFLMGTDDPARKEWEENIVAVTRYACRAATMNGKEMDFDPDAMVQNTVVGFLGYHTPDGKSST